MSLVTDLQEAKKLWKEVSWITKIGVIIGTFLATSSIASLSDVVFQWKGFILDAVNFYSEWVTTPIKEYAAQFGLTWHPKQLDILLLAALQITASIRTVWVASLGKLYKVVLIVIYICLFFGFSYFYSGDVLPFSSKGYFFVLFLIISAPHMRDFNQKEKLVYFAPFLIALAVVGILGAINAGLSR